jgi:hypothetical protein
MNKKIILLIITTGLVGCSSNSNFTTEPECYLKKEGGVTTISCNGDKVEIYDGVNGIDGINGVDGLDGTPSVTEIIPLCPDLAGNHKEVVLNINGDLVAYFAQNGNATTARLTLLEEGTVYSTTDTNNSVCRFTVLDGEVLYD